MALFRVNRVLNRDRRDCSVHQLLLLCDLVKVDVKCFHTKYELTFDLI